jgi:hypothetical protein
MIEPLHKYNETMTERRKLARYRLERTLNARKGDSMTPDMNLGWSLRALGPGQREVLDELLRVFEQHPKTQDVANIAQHWADNMLKDRSK